MLINSLWSLNSQVMANIRKEMATGGHLPNTNRIEQNTRAFLSTAAGKRNRVYASFQLEHLYTDFYYLLKKTTEDKKHRIKFISIFQKTYLNTL